MLTTNEIRKKYLEFFKSKGHSIISHAPLIPENDPTLLFVNSGMFPLVPYLLGEKHPEGTRLCNVQPSFRSTDIEEVGDNRHNTLFEMLGNWSLGDYFKEEQLNWWYEFLVEQLKLDPHRLYQTVYAGSKDAPRDEESIRILKEIFSKYGVNAEEGPITYRRGEEGPGVEIDFSKYRIFAYVDKNWWQRGDAVGELGGPDSETFYDTGKEHNPKYGKYCHLNCDCGRFIEIGNSVFMQYKKAKEGWIELTKKNIDFGGGLERLAMVVQGKNNVFETDLFMPILNKISSLSGGKKYEDYNKEFEVIADHIRGAVFLIADGAYPSNLAQGYFVRRLIRRAIRYGKKLGIEEMFLIPLAKEVINILSGHYTHLKDRQEMIWAQIDKEEKKFRDTLEKGLKMFEKIVNSQNKISGKDAFILFSTYGFPIEMTQELAKERGLGVDLNTFKKEMQKHKELSRTASAGMFKGGLADASEETTKLHTATHLMNQALRIVLGEHVKQKGSNINKERLRFDFSHDRKLTAEEIKKVEDIVNEQIQKDLPVSWQEMSLEEARRQGALGVFESKYGEKVKVYSIGDFSKEICGGPHVQRTGVLGKFSIIKEESCGSGVRRIKAILE